VYRATKPTVDDKTLFFQYEYLRETLESQAAIGPVGVGVYLLHVEPGSDPTPVMAAVDRLFENGPQRVQTTTEAEFNRQFISMLGNVPALLSSIGGAVLFAIFFAVLNTMLMAARERIRDVGVLKALGFSDGAVFRAFAAESLLLCGAGGLAGIGLAKLAEPRMVAALAGQFPGFAVDGETLAFGMALALGVGLVAGVVPAWRSARLLPVEALRGEA
jgi:putative ABC transport system permease protein